MKATAFPRPCCLWRILGRYQVIRGRSQCSGPVLLGQGLTVSSAEGHFRTLGEKKQRAAFNRHWRNVDH